jgi:hypothetical protein
LPAFLQSVQGFRGDKDLPEAESGFPVAGHISTLRS